MAASKIDMHAAGSHLGSCLIDLQARLSACVLGFGIVNSQTQIGGELCVFPMFLKQTVNEVTNDKC